MTEQNDIFELFQEMVNRHPDLFPQKEKEQEECRIINWNPKHPKMAGKRTPRRQIIYGKRETRNQGTQKDRS